MPFTLLTASIIQNKTRYVGDREFVLKYSRVDESRKGMSGFVYYGRLRHYSYQVIQSFWCRSDLRLDALDDLIDTEAEYVERLQKLESVSRTTFRPTAILQK